VQSNNIRATLLTRLKTLWFHASAPWVFILVLAACCIWFCLYHQLTGVVIGVMGAGSTVLAFLEMNRLQKVLAAAGILILLLLEMRNIRQDHDESERQFHEQRENDESSFKKILKDNQAEFEQVMGQFRNLGTLSTMNLTQSNEALDRLNGVSQLARQSVNSITGGDGFCYALFHGKGEYTSDSVLVGSPTYVNAGDYPLYDLRVRFFDTFLSARSEKSRQGPFAAQGSAESTIGDLGPHSRRRDSRPIGFSNEHASDPEYRGNQPPEDQLFLITFQARNGKWEEFLNLVWSGNSWYQAFEVFRLKYPDARSGIMVPNGLLSQCVPLDFPLSRLSKVFPKPGLKNVCGLYAGADRDQ
jgi:hypothetical protein